MAVTLPLAGDAREALRDLFLAQGFARVGFTGAEPVDVPLEAWLADGKQASMTWMARDPEGRRDPRALLPGARSVICVGAAYPATDGRGHVAGYARAEDYHRTLEGALERAVQALVERHPGTSARVCVDAQPLLERALAARAGLGWIGRNTMLLDETHGPWMLLGEVLTDLAIAPDDPVAERCGTCTACVQACPTGALDGEQLDARRCLSYWSIEHRGELPEPWGAALGHRAFGCDDCLAACPFPARPPAETSPVHASPTEPSAAEASPPDPPPADPPPADPPPEDPPPTDPPPAPLVRRPDLDAIGVDELEARSRESFKRHFGSTPLERARKGGLLRNLAHVRRNLARRAEQPGEDGV